MRAPIHEPLSEKETPIRPADLARMLGVEPARISRAIRSGVFAKSSFPDPRGGPRIWLHPTAAVHDWNTYQDPDKSSANARGGHAAAKARSSKSRAPRPPGPAPVMSNGPSMVELKAQALRLKIQSDALALQRAKGILVEKAKVYASLFEAGKIMRLAFQSIPDRVVDAMLAAGSRAEAHAILTREIQAHLEQLADTLGRDLAPDEETG